MTRVALYARVSTDEQAERKVSIAAQLDALRSWGTLKGWEIVGDYIDEGYSGTKDVRPDFQRMMLDATQRRFDVICVAKLDRFMRNTRLFHKYIHDLEGVGARFIAIHEGIDTTDEGSGGTGRLFLNILAAFAEFESARIGERVRDSRRLLASQGRWACGRTLYGYRWNKEGRRFEVVEEEAAVVREVFHLYVNQSIGQVRLAQMLNERGYRTRKGHAWWARSIHDILHEVRYTGKDDHYTYPRVISDELFIAAERRRREARQVLRDPGKHLLQGLVRCGLCAHKIGPRHRRKTGRRIYKCIGIELAAHLDGSPRCTLKQIDASWLEEAVTNALVQAFASPENIKKHMTLRLEGMEAELRAMESLVAPLKAEMDRVKGNM